MVSREEFDQLLELVISRGQQLVILQDIILTQKKQIEMLVDGQQDLTESLHTLSKCLDEVSQKLEWLKENAHA